MQKENASWQGFAQEDMILLPVIPRAFEAKLGSGGGWARGKVELGSWGSLNLWSPGRCVLEPECLVLKLLFVLDGLPLC